MQENKIEGDGKLQKYKCFLEQLRYDGGLLWRIFGAYLLPHTVFLAFLLSVGFKGEEFIAWNPGVLIAAIFGCCFCVIWWWSCSRALALYDYSYIRTKRVEPPNWGLIKGEREEFKKGRWAWMKWHHKLRARHTVTMIIVTFFAMYFIIAIIQGLWKLINRLYG